jgi:hypothetical protein
VTRTQARMLGANIVEIQIMTKCALLTIAVIQFTLTTKKMHDTSRHPIKKISYPSLRWQPSLAVGVVRATPISVPIAENRWPSTKREVTSSSSGWTMARAPRAAAAPVAAGQALSAVAIRGPLGIPRRPLVRSAHASPPVCVQSWATGLSHAQGMFETSRRYR